MMKWGVLILALSLAGCVPGGVRDEDGTIDLGPNVFGDDPIYHKDYASFAEFAVATHEFDAMAKDGYSKQQQLCFANALMTQVPQDLRTQLDQFATGEKIFMESEYSALRKRLDRYLTDEDVARSAWSEFKTKCA